MNVFNICGFAPTTQQREAGGDELRLSSSDAQNQSLFLPMLMQLFGANARSTVKTALQNETPTNSPSLLLGMSGIGWESSERVPTGRDMLTGKDSAVQVPFVTTAMAGEDDSLGSDGKPQVEGNPPVAQHTMLNTMAVKGAMGGVVAEESASTKLDAVKNESETSNVATSTFAQRSDTKPSARKPVMNSQPNIIRLTVSGSQPTKDGSNTPRAICTVSVPEDTAPSAMPVKADETKIVRDGERFKLATEKRPATDDISVNFSIPRANNLFDNNDESYSALASKPIRNVEEIHLTDVEATVVAQNETPSSETPTLLSVKQIPQVANAQPKFANTAVERKPDTVTEITSDPLPAILHPSKTVNTIPLHRVGKMWEVKDEGVVKSSTREDNGAGAPHKVAAGKSTVVETIKSDFGKSLIDNPKEFELPLLREKHTNAAESVRPNVDDTARLWQAATPEQQLAASSELLSGANVAHPMNSGEVETIAKVASQVLSSHTQPTQHAAASNLGMFSPMTDLSQTLLDQVTKNLVFGFRTKSSAMRVALRPASLGEVVMKVKMEGEKLSAQIDVNNVNVKVVLEANIAQLRDTLTSRGIEVQRIDIIAAGQAGFGSPSGQNRSKQKSQDRNEADVDAIEQYKSLRTMGYNTMELTM